MAFIKIKIDDGSVVEESNDNSEKGHSPDMQNQFPHEMPDLQIVEIERNPERETHIPPLMIEDILREMENTREKIKKEELPN